MQGISLLVTKQINASHSEKIEEWKIPCRRVISNKGKRAQCLMGAAQKKPLGQLRVSNINRVVNASKQNGAAI